VADADASAVSVLLGMCADVLSIDRLNPAGPNTFATSMTYAVTFNVRYRR